MNDYDRDNDPQDVPRGDRKSIGYECARCGYEPSQREVDNGTCPQCKPAAKEFNWFFRWNEGGYNSVLASNYNEALVRAQAVAGDIAKLTVNAASLVPDADHKLTFAEDKRYRGMFD